MKPNSRQLAMRDPALAAIMGVSTGARAQADFGTDYGVHFGGSRPRVSFGDDGAAAHLAAAQMTGPAHPAHPMNPANQGAMMKMWNDKIAAESDTTARMRIIDPNANSTIKINRYSFSLNQDVVLGTPLLNFDISGSPPTNLRPERVTMNSPTFGMFLINEMKVANVSVADGTFDAAENNQVGIGQEYEMPTLTPSNKARVQGQYTGLTPPPFALGASYKFITTFKGPSTIIA
jgi:hypothetical protein